MAIKFTRKVIDQHNKITVLQIVGLFLLCIGVLIFVLFCFFYLSSSDLKKTVEDINHLGVPAAIAFLMIMLGISFLFPSMLKGGPNETLSTMRVSVYMITCIFIFLNIKYGWGESNFSNIGLGDSWTAIMIAALGGKAIQSFGERSSIGAGTTPNIPDKSANITSKTPQAGPSNQPKKS